MDKDELIAQFNSINDKNRYIPPVLLSETNLLPKKEVLLQSLARFRYQPAAANLLLGGDEKVSSKADWGALTRSEYL